MASTGLTGEVTSFRTCWRRKITGLAVICHVGPSFLKHRSLQVLSGMSLTPYPPENFVMFILSVVDFEAVKLVILRYSVAYTVTKILGEETGPWRVFPYETLTCLIPPLTLMSWTFCALRLASSLPLSRSGRGPA